MESLGVPIPTGKNIIPKCHDNSSSVERQRVGRTQPSPVYQSERDRSHRRYLQSEHRGRAGVIRKVDLIAITGRDSWWVFPSHKGAMLCID